MAVPNRQLLSQFNPLKRRPSMSRVLLAAIFFLLVHVSASASVTKVDGSFEVKNSEIYTVDSSILGRKYDVYVKLPNDYSKAENENRKYPVLYLNDGPHTFKVASGITHF